MKNIASNNCCLGLACPSLHRMKAVIKCDRQDAQIMISKIILWASEHIDAPIISMLHEINTDDEVNEVYYWGERAEYLSIMMDATMMRIYYHTGNESWVSVVISERASIYSFGGPTQNLFREDSLIRSMWFNDTADEIRMYFADDEFIRNLLYNMRLNPHGHLVEDWNFNVHFNHREYHQFF